MTPLLICQGDLLVAIVGDQTRINDELVILTADLLYPLGISVMSGIPGWMRPKDYVQAIVAPILWTQGDGKSECVGSELYKRQANWDASLPVALHVNSYTFPTYLNFPVSQFAKMISHAVGWHFIGMLPYHLPGTTYLQSEFPGDYGWHPAYIGEQRKRIAAWTKNINDGYTGGRPRNIPNLYPCRSRFRTPSY